MSSEVEEKFLVLTDEWQKFTPFETLWPLHLRQGNIPQVNEQGAKVFITFDPGQSSIAHIRFEKGELVYNVVIQGEPIEGDFATIQGLKAYNQETGEIELSGSVIGRLRSKTERTHILTFKDYTQDFECECFIDVTDANNIFNRYIPHKVEKLRHEVQYEGNKWEVDVFKGRRIEVEGEVYPLVTTDLENPATGFEKAAMLPGLGPNVKHCKMLRNDVLARTLKDVVLVLDS